MTPSPISPMIEAALQRARQYTMMGDIANADRCYREIVASAGKLAQAWYEWGELANRAGRPDAARPLHERATSLEPGNVVYRFAFAQTLARLDDLDRAEAELREVVRRSPNVAVAHHELGMLLKRCGRHEEAITCLRQAIKLDPDSVDARYNLGLALFAEGRYAAAEAAYRKAHALAPRDAEIASALGTALHALGRFDEANAALELAIELAPDYIAGHHNLGEALREQGRLDEAIAAYRQGLSLAPRETMLWHSLAMTRRFETPDDAEIEAMRTLYADEGLDNQQRRQLAFALAKAYDDCGEPARAWPCYETANRLARAAMHYDIGAEERRIEAIMACFDADFFAYRQNHGLNDAKTTPVFIVGMPRSGTSLVEQILASHSAVHGCGEIHDLRLALREGLGTTGSGADMLQAIRELDRGGSRRIARDYLKRLRAHGQGERLLTNKLPFNFLHIGIIRLLFPKARVIHCRRHPVATCLSIFQHDFTQMAGFAYDLTELGRYYRLYERLMAHWETILPGFIETVDYEALVADQEAVSHRLVSFCDLEWEPACLDFHRAGRPVSTASFTQVRQPIYRRAIEHWRRYEPFLGPLLETLGRDH